MGLLDNVQLHLVNSTEKAAEFIEWLNRPRRILGVDTETTGLEAPHMHKLRLIQFGDTTAGWAVPWDQWGGVALEALNKYDGELVLHNAPYDAGFIEHHTGYQIPWYRIHDTMTMAHISKPSFPKGLKPLGAMLVDSKAASAQAILSEAMASNKWTWATVPIDFPPYWVYAAMDPVLTCFIFERLEAETFGPYKNVYDLEIGTLRVLHKMRMRGALVDLEYSRRKNVELGDFAEKGRRWCEEAFGIKNIGSRPQLIKTFKDLGREITRTTNSGGDSIDKYQLQLLAYEGAGKELAQMVLDVRKAEKSTGPYFKNFIDMADADNRVHPTIWALGTRTARMSVSDPALQTLPKKEGLVRSAFIPTPGNALVTCDLDQVEMRMMAHFSKDPGLIKAFMDVDAGGGDFFINLAVQIYHDMAITKKDSRRQLTKNTAYGKSYGAGVAKMAETAGVPFEVMEPVVQQFDASFPGVKRLQKEIERVGLERLRVGGEPYIITPYGRKLPSDYDKVYVLVNYLIQSHAAEYLKKCILEADAAGLGEYMILPVHDELVMDVPIELVEEAKNIIEASMTDRSNYAVPITASADILPINWGTKYVDE